MSPTVLEKWRGNRTFFLACVVIIPFTIKALFFAEGDDLASILSLIGGMARDVFIGLGVSKVGDAAYHYSRASAPRYDDRVSWGQDYHDRDTYRVQRRQQATDYRDDPAGGRATPDSPD